MFTETCRVPAMSDESSAAQLHAALTAAAGVRSVRADIPNRRLILTYADPATPERLREIIESLGYVIDNGLTPLEPQE